MKTIERSLVGTLTKRLVTPPFFIQIVIGPRQVGKTTALEQVQKKWRGPSHYATADLPTPPDAYWIQSQWYLARKLTENNTKPALLVLDEIQKVPRWGDVVKALFDEDKREKNKIRVVLLGSASLLIQHVAQESLAGRFEQHFCPHWSWTECQKAFGWSLKKWIQYGGYPGAAAVLKDSETRWISYISESLVETVLSKDVFQLTSIAKPALMRHLFKLTIQNPAQILSYNKMLGQLQDAGNTVTLAHYLNVLSNAFLISGLQLWSKGLGRVRASSPKLIAWNNGLITALSQPYISDPQSSPEFWGRLVENAVGAHILNQLPKHDQLYYWRHRENEVDFVVEKGKDVLLIEVKTGHAIESHRGLDEMKRIIPKSKALIVGTGGVPLEKFFSSDINAWF